MTRRHSPCVSLIVVLAVLGAAAGAAAVKTPSAETRMAAETFAGLELRNIGPALMSGRIADIALDPTDPTTWYVAVGSGGVWKTVNAGTTWTPLFDDQASYSIGCVTVDPSNPHTVWVGTGENVGGRHVGFGDGVYRSDDGGTTWNNLGLPHSEHISKIVVHPDDSDVVWVASQGPLWSPGGDRGLFKSVDGGATWTKVLGDDRWTGVTDIALDPRNPDRLYAATWQRQRTIATYVGGGPGSGIYRSDDGGGTWTRLTEGLPEGNLGKIGLAISPQRPDIVYAAIELDRRTGGIWRSSDRGASWDQRSETVSGATGPHYYQELVASPHVFDRLYLMDTRIQISDDGGVSFRKLPEADKHPDNHALVFRPDDPEWLLVGTDGGLYESYDSAASWRFVANLPVTQFYKVAVDDAEPFYTIYGGTQDNNTQGGPSRTDTANGIRNADWFVTLFADGHQPAVEPGNPDIMYSEFQEGNLFRVDRTTGEVIHIQPQPEPGDPAERFNWDAPILVSPHSPTRLYYASQRVWRSDDRGDSWRPISGDLTRDQDRMLLNIMDRQWSWDAPWDMFAMSAFDTITSVAESPLVEGLLYAGTDDGLIQVTENGGATWRSIEVGSLPGVPADAFVNDLKADLHDADTVYVALDHHKSGDFSPYLLKSTDRGRSWTSIAGDLPDRHLVWRLVQDHVNARLLFVGTEFGVFFTVDGGSHWVELEGGVPTIPFRDLAIQRRENDLVGASFGRGFFVLDDYTFLRDLTPASLEEDALLFAPRQAWWYIERTPLGEDGKASQGAAYFTAPNPDFGAVVTYYLRDDLESREARRQAAEKPKIEAGEDTPRPSWEALEAERRESEPAILLTVRDADGSVVRRLEGPTEKGFHRVAWDLRFPPSQAIAEREPSDDEEEDEPRGFLAAPGRYSVTLSKKVDGRVTDLVPPAEFEVERLRRGALPGAEPVETVAFWQRLASLQRNVTAMIALMTETTERVDALAHALERSTAPPGDLDSQLHSIRQTLFEIDQSLTGNRSKRAAGEPIPPAVQTRLRKVVMATSSSTYGPTPTHLRTVEIAERELSDLGDRLREVLDVDLLLVEQALEDANAPWVPGQPLPLTRGTDDPD